MNTSQLKKFKIDDDIVVDAVKNLVYREGEEIPVSPKGIQILLFLIAKNGELATYQEFETELWHGYNSQTSLYQQVASLRRCLGDSSTRPKYIKTISKQGYAFVGKCEPVDPAAAQGSKPKSRCSFIALSLCVAVMFLAGLGGYFTFGKKGIGGELAANAASATSQLYVKSFADKVDLPSTVIGLELPVESNNGELLGAVNTLLFTTKFHLETQSEYHVATLPAATVRDDWAILQQHFAEAGGLRFVYQPFIEQRSDGFYYGIKKKSRQDSESKLVVEPVVELHAESIAQMQMKEFEEQLLDFFKREHFNIKSDAQFEAELDWRRFASLIQFPQNNFIPAEIFDDFYAGFVQLKKEGTENLVIYSSAWDIIFATLDQQNIYNTSPVISTLMNMTEVADRKMPDYFKTYHAKAEYYCRILNYERCEEQLVKAYQRKPFDYGIIGNVRFYLIEFDKSTLLIDWVNHMANPFAPGVYSFYRNSLLKKLELSEAEQLAKNFSQWNSNRNNWYVISQTKAEITDLHRFSQWYKEELKEKPRHQISKYNAYMLLNGNFYEEASALYSNGLEKQPYFDLLIIDLMADIWKSEPDIQKWKAAKQKAEDRHEFQNALDKLYLAYFDMYFDDKRGARGYIEEIFPELNTDEIVITKDNFRYAVYFNETIKEIGDHRRSVSMDYALNSFLQKNPDLHRNASFGLADVEFYALTSREDLAAKRLEKAVIEEGWVPNAFWMWPPLKSNPFLNKISSTDEFQRAQSYLKEKYSDLCLSDC